MEHLLKSATSVDYETQGHMQANGAKCVFSSVFYQRGLFRSRRRHNCLHHCLFWWCAVWGSMGACWPGQLGHGAIGNWFAQRSVRHRGSILLHRSWGVHILLYWISLRSATGLFSPWVASICCGSWGLQRLYWTTARSVTPRTVQPKSHFHALWWQLVVSWASWPAGRADGWHSKLGHRVLCARISGAFCCSGHPDHGGHLRAISCDAARWLAQLLGAQSPFASLRPLTVRTISAHGCGQQPSSHRQVEMAQQASGWQTTVRSVTC